MFSIFSALDFQQNRQPQRRQICLSRPGQQASFFIT
jgi:hypothetical protein